MSGSLHLSRDDGGGNGTAGGGVPILWTDQKDLSGSLARLWTIVLLVSRECCEPPSSRARH